MGVVVCWPKKLAARDVLKDCGNPTQDAHIFSFNGLRGTVTRQGRAVRAQQKDGLNHVALGLFDRQCC